MIYLLECMIRCTNNIIIEDIIQQSGDLIIIIRLNQLFYGAIHKAQCLKTGYWLPFTQRTPSHLNGNIQRHMHKGCSFTKYHPSLKWVGCLDPPPLSEMLSFISDIDICAQSLSALFKLIIDYCVAIFVPLNKYIFTRMLRINAAKEIKR